MRALILLVLLSAGCLGSSDEDGPCPWQDTLTNVSPPADQCARYTVEGAGRFRVEGSDSCAREKCVILAPGERANLMADSESTAEIQIGTDYGPCDSLPECP